MAFICGFNIELIAQKSIQNILPSANRRLMSVYIGSA